MNAPTHKTELICKPWITSDSLEIHVATARAKNIARVWMKRYDKTARDFFESNNLPAEATIFVSPCFDPKEVEAFFSGLMD